MNKIISKTFFAFIIICFAFTTGCSNSDTNAKNGDDEKVVITWSMWSDSGEEKEVWQELADKVTEKYPDIEVDLQTSAFSGYYDKLTTQISSGNAPDIMALQATRVSTFGEYDAFEPLNKYLDEDKDFDTDDFFDGILDSFSYGDEQIVIPYDYGPSILYYNKDLFDKENVEYPEDGMTWDEFLEKAESLTTDDSYGFAFAKPFTQTISWIWNNGGKYMNEDMTESLIQEPEATEALQFLGDMIYKYEVAMPISDPGNLDFDTENFYSGSVGMVINGPWNIINTESKADFEWDISTIPVGEDGPANTGNGSGFGISSDSKHKEEAWKALSVILGKEGEEFLAEKGRAYPARESAMEAYEKSVQEPKNFEAVTNSNKYSNPLRTTNGWDEIDNMLTEEIGRIWFNNEPAENVTEDIVANFNNMLKEAKESVQ